MVDKQALTMIERFNNAIGIKFQLYNSLFTSLPFNSIEKTGVLLSLFVMHCEERYRKQQSPADIVDSFFEVYTQYKTEREKLDILFRFIQYSERQIVLFDAVEDAAFTQVTDVNGEGSLNQLQQELTKENIKGKLNDFEVRFVLTAHPTQFYPGEVLGIIHDLSKALALNNAADINVYLQQLGKTPFLKKQKPTPFDEAVNLMWFLENTFYPAAGNIAQKLKAELYAVVDTTKPLLRLGFWPGGDRDGNPFVKTDTTIKVAAALKSRIIRCYYADVRKLRRRLTFSGVFELVSALEKKLCTGAFAKPGAIDISIHDIVHPLKEIKNILAEKHGGMFINLVDDLLNKTEVFGLFFATLDVRQDSHIHTKVYEELSKLNAAVPANYATLSEDDKINVLTSLTPLKNSADCHTESGLRQPAGSIAPQSNTDCHAELVEAPQLKKYTVLSDELLQDALDVTKAIKQVQQQNGEEALNRYIISHSTSALSVLEVYGLFLLSGWKADELTVDIVPLFETIEDLKAAAGVMKKLYENEVYAGHLKLRNNTQTIMVGFSDGTKDGGYLMANWCIYKAKEALTALSKEYNINVVFFDGRGGPPARGGGKTQKFYSSLGNNISNKQIQLTIQGQTISSNFGNVASTQYNIEQLLHAGISSNLSQHKKPTLNTTEEALLATVAEDSYNAYVNLKTHPQFLDYLLNISPLKYYADTNIGSRPAKRNNDSKFSLDDLRAIPYVGAWTQLKQNVTGYYGVGTALLKAQQNGDWQALQRLYNHSLYFRTLIDNSEMTMRKSFMPLTAYLKHHTVYGEIWNMINDEFELTKKMILALSNSKELMENNAAGQESINVRERIVLPLTTIQQYSLNALRTAAETNNDLHEKADYEKLVMRCSFGIINAGRNSV